MFFTSIFTKTVQKVDVEIIDLKSKYRAMVRKFLFGLAHNDNSENQVQTKTSLKLKDKIEKNKLQDNSLASEYMVAIAKNFYIGELKSKRITSSDSMNNEAKEIINELYKEQISKTKKLYIRNCE